MERHYIRSSPEVWRPLLLQHVIERFILPTSPMHMTKPRRALFLVAVVSAFAAVACGIAIKRDLSTIPQGQVGFDDMCGLQDYFDALEAKVAKEPTVASSLDLEGGDGQKTIRGGKARLVFQGTFLLKHARRVLEENWRRLPEELATTDKIEIEVRWAEKAGVKRVVTDQDAELFVGGQASYLPYHVCLSELLYGAPLYKQRQVLWGLPNPSAHLDTGVKDAGAPEAETVINATPEAGVAPDANASTPAAVDASATEATKEPVAPAPIPAKQSKHKRSK
jgi:hypothetical protein